MSQTQIRADSQIQSGSFAAVFPKDTFTSDGSGSVTLTSTPISLASMDVYLNGILQSTGYSVSDKTVTFSSAPAAGVIIIIRYRTL